MRYISRLVFMCTMMATALGISAAAQETQTRVVDEVVAQVNEGVITLSRIKRESKMIVDTYVQEGKSREEAQKMVDSKQGELIAGLINEELLIQKAKESGLESEIEADLNRRLNEIMKEQKFKTVEELYAAMERTGVNPQELRETWRKQATRDRVIQREVQSRVFWKFTGKEVKDYYEKNKAKFTKPETISLSEVFLGFAGRDEETVRKKARDVLAQLRAGADFAKVASENDPAIVAPSMGGSTQKIPVKDLADTLGKPLADVKVGGFTEPIEVEGIGLLILRVDEREKASQESVFDERVVRMAMLQEHFPEEQKKFLASLRENAYIKISEAYRPIVSPVLFADERKTKTAN